MTVDPEGGVELFRTVRAITELVVLDEQCDPVHVWPVTVVMVAVFTIAVVAEESTVTANVTVTESPGASATVMTIVFPVAVVLTLTEQVSDPVAVPQTGVVLRATFDGSGSVTTAVPDDVEQAKAAVAAAVKHS